MSLLNPLLLGGLLLATLPILIHLLARRRLKRQPFSTLDFLQRLQTKRMKQLRMRQWLLLLLRTLAVLLLALAFLRPVISDQAGLGAGSSESVLLVDLSASMVARGAESETPLDRIRDTIRDLWPAFERVSLVVMDKDGSRDITPRAAGGSAPAWIDRLAVDGRSESLSSGWNRAVERLEESDAATRELILLSDFTGPGLDSLPELPQGTRLYHLNLASRASVTNAYIRETRFSDAVLRPGATTSLEVVAEVSGTDEPVRCIVTVTLDGRRVAEGEIELTPSAPSTISFPVQVPDAGQHAGEVALELNDALASDNRFPFLLQVPGSRRVLLTGDDVQALRYMELALDPEGRQSAFEVEIRPGRVRAGELSAVDVVVVAGWQNPDAATARQLAQFVRDGGGLWILLDDRTDLGRLSRTLLAEVGFAPLADERGRSNSVTQWEDMDLDHPALRSLFDGEGQYDRPAVGRLYTAHAGKGERAIIRVSDGRPFLLERSLGGGRAWLTPSAANRSWTDWPISGVFAPLVQQGVSYLAGDAVHGGSEVRCGETIVWQTPIEGEGRSVEAIDPLGNRVPAFPEFREGRQAYVTSATLWPGHYRLQVDGIEQEEAAVHVPATESRLAVESIPAWAGRELSGSGSETLAETLQQARTGRELSTLILIAVLLLLVAETIVAREGKPRPERSMRESSTTA
ncbi:BatA domain-containing protein [bacterium]|nr:BatA domain-containing protein [bacterium]